MQALRRLAWGLATLGLTTTMLAACGESPAASGTDRAAAPLAAASGAAFPIALSSALGVAHIAAAPERVVTLGLGADDLALSLGVVPVGVQRADWGGDAEHFWPWVRRALEDGGHPLPARITMYPELDVEAILALKPDLVLAPFSGVSEKDYALLSRFVPVVAYPGQPFLTPVPAQIGLAAQALGKAERAAELQARVATALREAAQATPELRGKSFAYVRADLGSGNFAAYVAGDPRVDTLLALGLTLAPSVQGLHASAGHFAHYLGFEHADSLADVDVLVSWFYSDEESRRAHAMPLYAGIPAVSQGRELALTDATLVMASSSGTPLAVEWMLGRLLPRLADAARRVPERP